MVELIENLLKRHAEPVRDKKTNNRHDGLENSES